MSPHRQHRASARRTGFGNRIGLAPSLTDLLTDRVSHPRFCRNTSGLDGGLCRVGQSVRPSMAWRRSRAHDHRCSVRAVIPIAKPPQKQKRKPRPGKRGSGLLCLSAAPFPLLVAPLCPTGQGRQPPGCAALRQLFGPAGALAALARKLPSGLKGVACPALMSGINYVAQKGKKTGGDP